MTQSSPLESDQDIGMLELLGTARKGWKFILASAIACGAFAWVVGRLLPTSFKADCLVQIDTEANRSTGLLGDLAKLAQSESKAETEAELIQSRAVVGPVIQELGLDNWWASKGLTRKLQGKAGRLQIPKMTLPPRQVGAPAWTLVALDADSNFILRDPAGRIALRGIVGQWADTLIGHDTLGILLESMESEPGEIFTISKLPFSSAYKLMAKKLTVAEKGKATGILQLGFSADTPERAANILNAIADSYVHQNVDVRSGESRKTLEFLQAQLPKVRFTLDSLEGILNSYRFKKGTVDIGSETRVILQERSELQQQLIELGQRRQELLRLYKEDHPSIEALEAQRTQLIRALAGSSNQVKQLPLTQQQLDKLVRDVQATSISYNSLQNNIQQLEMVRGGELGSARVVDRAIPPSRKTSPIRAVLVILGLGFGAAGAYSFLFLKKLLRRGIEKATVLESMGIPVLTQIPFSSVQKDADRKTKGKSPARPLAEVNPSDLTVESMRSLRIALDVSLTGSDRRIVAISGLMEGDGKSFVAQNLACLFAQTGRKVVLVDADMRLGHQHQSFGLRPSNGLAELLLGKTDLESALLGTGCEGLKLIPCGLDKNRPTELLSSPAFAQLLSVLSSRFDFVVLDTPPVLHVTDPLVVMRASTRSILVAKAGAHSRATVIEAMRRAKVADVQSVAMVLNRCDFDPVQYEAYRPYGDATIGNKA